MKRFITVLLTSALAITSTTAKQYNYESVAGDPMQTRIYTLDNGLKVYLSANHENARIKAHVAVRTGSRNDPAETTGLAHYLEHLMFKGTQRFGTTDYAKEAPLLQKISDLYEEYRTLTDPQQRKQKYHEIDSVSQLAAKYNIPNEYDKMMSAIGSEGTNAYTSHDVTCYVENIPSNELERWCMIQSERFPNLVMRGFHTELEAVYEEKNITLTKDTRKTYTALFEKLFPTHPYGTQTTIGTQEHLKNPSQVNIRNYYNKYYVPNNIAICLAGDFDYDKAIAMIDQYFGAWKPGNNITPPSYPEQPQFTTPKDTTILGVETEKVMIGWRLDKGASLQNDTITMIDMLLSNGDVGLIDLDLNQKMKVLSAGSGVWGLRDYSIFMFIGAPKEGQTVEDVRTLLLGELDKIKNGEWDEKLLHSIVTNWKLAELKALDSNASRVDKMVDAYIVGMPWEQHVKQVDRLAKLTKHDIMEWAKKHLNDGYVCVYKKKGEDTTIVKIDKPIITPIPSNRDMQSEYMKAFIAKEVEPIHPQFVDFDKELTFATTKSGQPVIYKQNTTDDRFTLIYRYDFGSEADKRYTVANGFYDLLGTKKESVETIKRKFYDIACSYSVAVGSRTTAITISGLQEDMPKAVEMLDEYLTHLNPDTAIYNQYIKQVMKSRKEARTNQKSCYGALVEYGLYGPKNPLTCAMTPEEYRTTPPSTYTDMIKGLYGMKHEVLYWGPASVEELDKIISKKHKVAKKLADVPANKPYEKLKTAGTEIYIAPYDAKNINMRMINNENKPWEIEHGPIVSLFNEYFGGSMNAIVFQELRESRGLAYNAWASYVTPSRKDDTEYYQQHIISQSDKLMDCINVFREITDSIPQSQTLFNTAQQSLVKSIAATRTTKAAVISKYLAMRRLGVDYDLNKLYYTVIPTLTLDDVINFEKKNVAGKPLKYMILGKEEDIDVKALEKIATVKRLTLDDIFPAYE